MTLDPSPATGFSRVLQGQEFSTLRGNFAESNECDTAEKSVAWPPSLDDEKIDVVSASRQFGSENWMSSGRHEAIYTDLLSGFGVNADASHGTRASFVDQAAAAVNVTRKQSLDQEGKFNLLANPWSLMPSSLSLNLSASNPKGPVQGSDVAYQAQGNARYGSITEYPVLHCQRVEHPQGNWLMPPPAPCHFENPAHSRELMPKPMLVQCESVKPKDGNYKLFGIPLISNPVTPEPVTPRRSMINEPAGQLLNNTQQVHTNDSDQKSEQSRGSKSADNPLPLNEKQKSVQTCEQHSREVQGKALGGSTRSCTKVTQTVTITISSAI